MNGCSDKRTLTCKTKRSLEKQQQLKTQTASEMLWSSHAISQNQMECPIFCNVFFVSIMSLVDLVLVYTLVEKEVNELITIATLLFMNELKLFLELFLFPRGCYCFVLTALLSHCFYWHNSFSQYLYSKTQLSIFTLFENYSKCRIWILAFSTNFCPINIDLSSNTVWPHASAFKILAKMDHFGIFN